MSLRLRLKLPCGSIRGDKDPGPDRYSFSFFHKNWDIVGHNVVQAVQHFFSTEIMSQNWNATGLSHSQNYPVTTKCYRSFACCNVIYKCVTKVLANFAFLDLSLSVSLRQGQVHIG